MLEIVNGKIKIIVARLIRHFSYGFSCNNVTRRCIVKVMNVMKNKLLKLH